MEGAGMAIDRMERAGRAAYESDNETIFALIKQMVMDSPLLRAVFISADYAGWTPERIALVAAYTFILKDQENTERMLDMVNRSTRPILMTTHCKTCTCKDKSVNYEDL
jgi:hypothetical protein